MSLLLCLVIAVSDGDTLKAQCQGRAKPITVRLLEIDAPEVKHTGFVSMPDQPFGQAAKSSLMSLCYKQQATLHTTGLDRYRRTLAKVTCQSVDASKLQASSGLAWVASPQKRSTIPSLVATARAAHMGLWADANPINPADWRKGVR